MKSIKAYFLCIGCFVLILKFLSADSLDIEYYNPQNILNFAEFLYQGEDYLRAAGEYQRYIFTGDSLPEDADFIYYKIGKCYRLTKNYNKAIEYFQKSIDENTRGYLLHQANYQIALCYFLMDEFKISTTFLDSSISIADQDEIRQCMERLLAINYIQQKKWSQAVDLLDINKNPDPATRQLANFTQTGQQLPQKNKVLAGLYSTLIPGTGKLYCGRPFDGMQSLLTTAILGWQAYDGFNTDGIQSVKGWIFGSIGGVLYLGNIYGSVVAAEIYNAEQEEKFITRIKVFINVDLD